MWIPLLMTNINFDVDLLKCVFDEDKTLLMCLCNKKELHAAADHILDKYDILNCNPFYRNTKNEDLLDINDTDSAVETTINDVFIDQLNIFLNSTTRLPAHKLTKPDSLLEKAGFTLQRRIESEWGLLHSDWWRKENSTTLSQ